MNVPAPVRRASGMATCRPDTGSGYGRCGDARGHLGYCETLAIRRVEFGLVLVVGRN